MKLARWYTVFGRLYIDVEGIGSFQSLDELLKIIWKYANGQTCNTPISIDSGKQYALKVGNMKETLHKDITPIMIFRVMELEPSEYEILFRELIRASKTIFSTMNVKEIYEINLNKTRDLTNDEIKVLKEGLCPVCKNSTRQTIDVEYEGSADIIYYKCSQCNCEYSVRKEPISGRLEAK